MTRFYRYPCAIVLTLLVLRSSGTVHAQGIDSRGTEFMITFMPTNGYDLRPVLAIGVSASRPTTGSMRYMVDGSIRPISITSPNAIHWIELDVDRLLPEFMRADSVSATSLALSFAAPVSIVGANTMRWSGDAFLALPNDALGREYTLLSYPSPINPQPLTTSSDFPSQFSVVATEDGTAVTITPSTRLFGRNGARENPYTVLLNRGDVYLATALRTDSGAGRDVSGTVIESSRPVAVYAGVQRANIPWHQANGRDHLVEQIIPDAYRQTDAIVTPHFHIEKTYPDSTIFRVVASAAGETTVMVDGRVEARLGRGEVLEMPLDSARHITASAPILVAQYHHSPIDETLIRVENDSVGDPTMMIAPSPSQFDTSFVFQSLGTVNYWRHFINVIARSGFEGDLQLDGVVPEVLFTPIGTSGYSYAQIEVEPGSHHIRSSTPFGLLVYGYGPYTSYGYPGGLVLVRPPAGAPDDPAIAADVTLSPNPVIGDASTLSLHLDEPGSLRVEIIDPSGARAGTAIERALLEPGEHSFEIDVSELPAGAYALELSVAGKRMVRRMMVVR